MDEEMTSCRLHGNNTSWDTPADGQPFDDDDDSLQEAMPRLRSPLPCCSAGLMSGRLGITSARRVC
ncbi:hypothetical protein BDZ89DRAFT_1072559 [Hymenopellis radicata]|nr:hypothetical protein BDZ89DRAFT_1072559 [Hymenopellis radicata]